MPRRLSPSHTPHAEQHACRHELSISAMGTKACTAPNVNRSHFVDRRGAAASGALRLPTLAMLQRPVSGTTIGAWPFLLSCHWTLQPPPHTKVTDTPTDTLTDTLTNDGANDSSMCCWLSCC